MIDKEQEQYRAAFLGVFGANKPPRRKRKLVGITSRICDMAPAPARFRVRDTKRKAA